MKESFEAYQAEEYSKTHSFEPLEIRGFAEEIGLNWDSLTPEFKRKLFKTIPLNHLEASRNMNELATLIIESPEISKLSPTLNKEEIRQAILLTDIGKSGPLEATEAESELIIEIFKKNNIENSEKTKIGDFCLRELPKSIDLEKMIATLNSLSQYGVYSNTTMREFYNMHTVWSRSILDSEPQISEDVKKIIDHHHALEGVNAQDTLSLKDKIVISIDKYDAVRDRGKKFHEEAINWIQNEKLQKGQYKDDLEFQTILEVLKKVAPTLTAYKDKPKEKEEIPKSKAA